MKLAEIIKKNFKILIRSKASALVIFLGPLLIVSLLGLAFSNSESYGLNIGVYSGKYNDFSDSLLEKLKENNFKINKYHSQESCINDAKQGDANVCIILPDDMSLSNNEVVFHVDYSKVNIVWMVIDTISEKVSAKSQEIRESLTSQLLEKMVQTRNSMDSQKKKTEEINKAENQAKEKAEIVQTKLDNLDVTINLNDLKLSDMKSKVSSIETKAKSVSSTIEDVIDAVNSSGLSQGEKNSIIGDLEDAAEDLDAVLSYVSGQNNTGSLNYLVNELESKLVKVQGQLAGLAISKKDAEQELGVIKSIVNDNINKLNDLKNSIDSAIGNIKDIGEDQKTQIVSPIKTRIEPLTTKKTHFNYLFPTLIVLIIMITAILLSSTLVMNEKKSKSFFRNFISPTKDIVFDLGMFITAFLVIFCQLVIFLLIAGIFFQTNIFDSIATTPVILLLVIFVFIFIGMLIGYIFKSPETSVLASITVSALLLFFSSTVLPIESIPHSIRSIAYFSPFVLSESLLRQAMFFGFSYLDILVDLLTLAVYVLILFILTVVAQKSLRTSNHFSIKLNLKKKKE